MIEAEKGERFGWENGGERFGLEKGRESFGDTMLLALKMEEGVTSQGVQVASRSWKWQVNGFSPRACRRNTVLLTP